MITYDMIIDAQSLIVKNWGEQGKRVIEECAKVTPFNDSFEAFLSHCTACGGDWGGMILTGVKYHWEKVWDAIPNEMGAFAFPCICAVLTLCGVDANKDKN